MQTSSLKLHPGAPFPRLSSPIALNKQRSLLEPRDGCDWLLVLIYRGKHCPLCTKYLNQLETFKQRLSEAKVDIVAISGDSHAQLNEHLEKLDVSYPLAYGLSLQEMKKLGVYISDPRSEQETDHPFSEPALFVVNERQELHVVDLSNNPFVRPDLETLVNGIEWIRNPDNNYPIRGMHE